MQFNELLSKKTINLNLESTSKSEAITELVNLLNENGRVNDKASFLNDVLARENIESTDMGIGIAIPHGKSEAMKKTSIAIGRLTRPIYWNEEKQDEVPIYAIFLLAVSPNDKGVTHLELISKIASLLIEDDFIETLKTEQNESRLLNTIRSRIGEM
ncbi:MAG: PTS sugar transporter subunit IIA [Anaerolineaceae bacterium]|nr:PTS sugar transporter subunit IIA [Anaerolineaceae bacterium]